MFTPHRRDLTGQGLARRSICFCWLAFSTSCSRAALGPSITSHYASPADSGGAADAPCLPPCLHGASHRSPFVAAVCGGSRGRRRRHPRTSAAVSGRHRCRRHLPTGRRTDATAGIDGSGGSDRAGAPAEVSSKRLYRARSVRVQVCILVNVM